MTEPTKPKTETAETPKRWSFDSKPDDTLLPKPKPPKAQTVSSKPKPKPKPKVSQERIHAIQTKLSDDELAAFDAKLDGRARSKIVRQLILDYSKP